MRKGTAAHRSVASAAVTLSRRPLLLALIIIGCFATVRWGLFDGERKNRMDEAHGRGIIDASSLSPSPSRITSARSGIDTTTVPAPFASYPTVPTNRIPNLVSRDIPVRDHSVAPASILAIVGIPTTDTPFGANRRRWQRTSWLRYRHVWAPERACKDEQQCLLVKYLIGRHPSHDYAFSDALRSEVATFRGDIIALDMKEGAPSTGKKSGGAGYWGLEAEVGMSRKALIWYRISLVLFAQAMYVMKCDDDVFIRVPQYVHDLWSLHTKPQHHRAANDDAGQPTTTTMLYWGKVMKWGAVKGDPNSKFYFVGGMSITMSKALAERITSHAPIQEHANHEFPTAAVARGDGGAAAAAASVTTMYKSHNMDHEDVMIGRIVYNLKLNVTMVKDCRYHDVHKGANIRPVSNRSVAIHHLNGEEYEKLFLLFGEDDVGDTQWRVATARQYHTAYTPC